MHVCTYMYVSKRVTLYTTTPLEVRLSGRTKLNTISKTILVINIIIAAISNTRVNMLLRLLPSIPPLSRNNTRICPNKYRIHNDDKSSKSI